MQITTTRGNTLNLDNYIENEIKRDSKLRAKWKKEATLRTIALTIIRYRIKHKISQSGLAEKIGITRMHLSRIENMNSNPGMSTLYKIAKALNLKLKLSLE